MSAEITPLYDKSDPTKGWGATAAAADCTNRVPNDAPFLAVWIEKNEKGQDVVKWSKANTDFLRLGTMALVLLEFTNACIRDAVERD